MGNSCLKVFGDRELQALQVILRYCDLGTVANVARCSKACSIIVRDDDVWKHQKFHFMIYNKIIPVYRINETHHEFMRRMILTGKFADMSAFPIESHFYSFGIWQFVVFGECMYVSMKKFPEYVMYKIVLGCCDCRMYMRYRHRCITMLECKLGLSNLESIESQFGEFLKKDRTIHTETKLEQLLQEKRFPIPTAGKMFLRQRMEISIEKDGLIIWNVPKYKMVFPLNGMPIFNDIPFSHYDRDWDEVLYDITHREYTSSDVGNYGDAGCVGTSISL